MSAIDLDWLRSYALSFPGATEDVQWESDLLFRIGGKMFTVFGLEGGGMSLKVSPEEFGELTQQEGIAPSKYLARYYWIRIDGTARIGRRELERLVAGSYAMVAAKLPKKVRKELGIEDAETPSLPATR